MSGRQIGKEIRWIKFWLRKLIHAQVKQELTDKQQAQIKDLGLDLSPIKRESLLSQSQPLSRQSTVGFHGTGTRYLRQPWFGYKIESINLTNDFGLERGPLCASYIRPSPIIQIKDE